MCKEDVFWKELADLRSERDKVTAKEDDIIFAKYGEVPHVGSNGNWWVGNNDTGLVMTEHPRWVTPDELNEARNKP